MGVVSLGATPFYFMEIHFNELIEKLKQNLGNNMPGELAHNQMMPEGRITMLPHENIPIPCAILIVLYEEDKEIFFPIIRRSVYDGLHSGQMGFPGGKFNDTDNSLISTALRESHEEIGISTNDIIVLGTLSNLYIPITNMQVTPVVGYLKTKPNFILDSHEVDALYTININDLVKKSNKAKESWNIRGEEILVPHYQIQEQKIWGATAMILSELEQLLLQCSSSGNFTG